MELKKTLLLTAAMVFTCSTTALADDGHTFPEKGKVYVIHRFNDNNSYIYENRSVLNTAPKTNTNKQYWQFVPTEKANCYYIQNVTSKRYVQSSNTKESQQIKVGNTPVEFEIKQNTTEGAAPKGYYYMCSTDQTIDNTKDGTLGLNYAGGQNQVVAYHIRYNRGNSYWDIQESAYDYEAPAPPAPIERSEYSKRLGIYILPCGDTGAAYLKSLSITGENGNVTNALNYTASAQPSNYYNMVRTDSAEVIKGKTFNLKYEAEGMTSDYTVTAYFDWDKDGVFESKHEFLNNKSGSAEITVPAEAAEGKSRMRIRVNDNDLGLDGADDDVYGATYDFQIFVTSDPTVTKVNDIVANNGTDATASSAAYGIDGRRVNPKTHKGAYIQNRQKKIK